jgi:hypothetical protein
MRHTKTIGREIMETLDMSGRFSDKRLGKRGLNCSGLYAEKRG